MRGISIGIILHSYYQDNFFFKYYNFMQTLADGKALLREVVQRCQEEHTRVNLDYSFEFCNEKFNTC